MNNYLRKNERCPIHGSRFCTCHKAVDTKAESAKKPTGPIRRIEDAHSPRGYREVCSPAELRKRKHAAIVKQGMCCWFCGAGFDSFLEVELHHIRAKAMGGASRDDHPENLAAVHSRLSERGCHAKIHNGQERIA